MNRVVVTIARRGLATPAKPAALTPEVYAKALEKIEMRKKFIQKTTLPVNFGELGFPHAAPVDPKEVAIHSGFPAAHADRTVLIQPHPKKLLQSGGSDHEWTLTWKAGPRWTNPLMGWTSTADPLSSVKLTFDSADDAVRYARENGLNYDLLAPHDEGTVEPGSFNYSHNFLSTKVLQKLKDEGPKSQEYVHGGAGHSNWFQPLKYHGDGIVRQHGEQIERPYPAL